MSDQFKTEVINHDNAAKFTGLSCKLHIFAYWKCTRNNVQSYRTTAHTLFIISAIYFLLRMHFVDFSRNCFGSFLADWRRSWWYQSWEVCLECHCDTFDRDRCMNSLRKRCLSICSRSMVQSAEYPAYVNVQLRSRMCGKCRWKDWQSLEANSWGKRNVPFASCHPLHCPYPPPPTKSTPPHTPNLTYTYMCYFEHFGISRIHRCFQSNT